MLCTCVCEECVRDENKRTEKKLYFLVQEKKVKSDDERSIVSHKCKKKHTRKESRFFLKDERNDKSCESPREGGCVVASRPAHHHQTRPEAVQTPHVRVGCGREETSIDGRGGLGENFGEAATRADHHASCVSHEAAFEGGEVLPQDHRGL